MVNSQQLQSRHCVGMGHKRLPNRSQLELRALRTCSVPAAPTSVIDVGF